MIFCVYVDYSCVLGRRTDCTPRRVLQNGGKENKSDVFMLLSLRHLQIGSDTNGGLTLPGYRGSRLLLRPLPGIYTSDTHVRHMLWLPLLRVWKSTAQMGLIHFYALLSLVPIERRCHVTAGVAKQANTSSVLLKWVRWGMATAWPRHWPHIRTCPLWVLAADVWLVWHAATSAILEIKNQRVSTAFQTFIKIWQGDRFW